MWTSFRGKIHEIDGHIGDHLPLMDGTIGDIPFPPIAVLIPGLEIQPKGFPGQSVKAVPESGIFFHIFTNLNVHDVSFLI